MQDAQGFTASTPLQSHDLFDLSGHGLFESPEIVCTIFLTTSGRQLCPHQAFASMAPPPPPASQAPVVPNQPLSWFIVTVQL